MWFKGCFGALFRDPLKGICNGLALGVPWNAHLRAPPRILAEFRAWRFRLAAISAYLVQSSEFMKPSIFIATTRLVVYTYTSKAYEQIMKAPIRPQE